MVDRDARPVLILAAPFSGASRLAALLGGHPQLSASPELSLFMADTVEQLRYMLELSNDVRADGLYRAIAQFEFGTQSADGIEQAQSWLAARDESEVAEVLAELSQSQAPRTLVVPDTESPLRPGDLKRLGKVRVLHLVRHPFAQGCAFAPWLEERLFVPPDFKDHGVTPPLIEPQIPWLRSNRNIEGFAAGLDARDYLRVRNEDLDQPATLAAICKWLNIGGSAAELAAMRQMQSWAFNGYGPDNAPRGLEADFLGDAPPSLAAAAARLDGNLPWRKAPIGFASEVRRCAAEYGY